MRLIDADKLKREDLCDICLSADCGDCFSNKNFEDWIANQPTAYDPDKIVEQLEELNEEEERFVNNHVFIQGIIEIVKGGAV